VLGLGLARLPSRDAYILATKVGRYGADDFDFSAARVKASVVDSMRRLGVDRVDVVHCHDVEFGDLGQVVTEALPALSDLKHQGVIRAIGVTGYPLPTLQRVLDAAPPGAVDVVLSYCHGCLADHALAPRAAAWMAAGLGVINASPLSMGLLTARGPPDWHPAPDALKAACREAAAAAAAAGHDISALALRDALVMPGVASHLVGCGSVDVVEANVAAAQAALRPPTEGEAAALAEVRRVLAPVEGTTWPSGRPENQ
jgi:L-galactose dehydrogenase